MNVCALCAVDLLCFSGFHPTRCDPNNICFEYLLRRWEPTAPNKQVPFGTMTRCVLVAVAVVAVIAVAAARKKKKKKTTEEEEEEDCQM